MHPATIAFLGGGNMAHSIIAGLIQDGYHADRIWVADRNAYKCQALAQQFNVHTTEDVNEACQHADIVILAVKPQGMASLADQIGKTVAKQKPLLISIAAGIRLDNLQQWFGDKTPIIRAMPNTPALVKVGATALIANTKAGKAQCNQAEYIMRAIGIIAWLKDEALIDVAGALAGSGPAYFFLFMEIMADVATEMGLSHKDARLLTLQTALGSAKLAYESSEDLSTLRQQVTSRGGITEAALKVFKSKGIADMIREAMTANLARSESLAKELHQNKRLPD